MLAQYRLLQIYSSINNASYYNYIYQNEMVVTTRYEIAYERFSMSRTTWINEHVYNTHLYLLRRVSIPGDSVYHKVHRSP